jgi:hypothetical protein
MLNEVKHLVHHERSSFAAAQDDNIGGLRLSVTALAWVIYLRKVPVDRMWF